jgi:hypothetical protein
VSRALLATIACAPAASAQQLLFVCETKRLDDHPGIIREFHFPPPEPPFRLDITDRRALRDGKLYASQGRAGDRIDLGGDWYVIQSADGEYRINRYTFEFKHIDRPKPIGRPKQIDKNNPISDLMPGEVWTSGTCAPTDRPE